VPLRALVSLSAQARPVLKDGLLSGKVPTVPQPGPAAAQRVPAQAAAYGAWTV